MASAANREFGRAKLSQKENQSRQSKGTTLGNAKPREVKAQKRTILGSITNVRVQPSRAAKVDGRQDENARVPQKVFGGKAKNQPFSIYVDQDRSFPSEPAHSTVQGEEEIDVENQVPTLDEAVASLPMIPQPAPRPDVAGPSYLHDMSVEEEDDEEDIEEDEVCMVAPSNPCQSVAMEQDHDNLDYVPEYEEDIYSYLLSVEHKNRPRPGFMRRQEDVTLAMRAILVDWLVEVAEEYKLQRETLFLTVSYIDRFLSQMSVLRNKLQLVGAAAMFLAAKYEEIYPPDVNEFVYITDDTYQKKQILRMEHMILKTLKFDITTPTINWFMERLLKRIHADSPLRHLTTYLCELVLVDLDQYLNFPSSMVAASALCLASYTLGYSDFWPAALQALSRYSLKQLTPCLQMMYSMHLNVVRHPQQAIREKYRHAKYGGASEVPPQPALCLK